MVVTLLPPLWNIEREYFGISEISTLSAECVYQYLVKHQQISDFCISKLNSRGRCAALCTRRLPRRHQPIALRQNITAGQVECQLALMRTAGARLAFRRTSRADEGAHVTTGILYMTHFCWPDARRVRPWTSFISSTSWPDAEAHMPRSHQTSLTSQRPHVEEPRALRVACDASYYVFQFGKHPRDNLPASLLKRTSSLSFKDSCAFKPRSTSRMRGDATPHTRNLISKLSIPFA
jgi:hypothetical protein